jgi:hypothetical protein
MEKKLIPDRYGVRGRQKGEFDPRHQDTSIYIMLNRVEKLFNRIFLEEEISLKKL